MTTDSPRTVKEQPAVLKTAAVELGAAAAEATVSSPVATTGGSKAAPCTPPAVVPPTAQDAGERKNAEEELTEAELRALEDVPALKAAAARAMSTRKYAISIEKCSLAAELLEKAYGPLSPKCADVLLLYGQALYAHAVSRSSPLGEKSSEEHAEEAPAALSSAEGVSATGDASSSAVDATAVAAAAAAQKEKLGRFVFHGDDEDGEDEEQEDEEDEEGVEEGGAEVGPGSEKETSDDLDIAWEVLDTARVIFSKMQGDAAKRQLAQTYITLGDVLLESEHFPEAVADFTSGLQLLTEAYGETDRKVAYAHYKLANALEFTSDDQAATKAIREVQKAIDILRKRIDVVRNGCLKVADEDEEIRELKGLVVDMEAKIEDIRTTPKELENSVGEPAKPATLADLLAQGKIDANIVNDLTALVKSKVKKEDAAVAKFFEDRLAAAGQKRKAEMTSGAEDAKKVKE